MPQVTSLDHLVLSVTDMERTLAFYTAVLGMTSERFSPADGSTRWALKFGDQKINLHDASAPFAPHAKTVSSGSADLCFLTDTSITDWQSHLAVEGVPIEEGPVKRTGATGPILSLYVRDPDGALIEISTPYP
ncbi:catechol 2,3-dioxygenase-like lactoylglutathione lyase family enzyme [Shimia isoporae]|uniref:Catechol 2,3-dioxygenase-like lactoylglutathione lyase family enzyme n=1 Tax=Shimia isoporae TaxID=647720 RepID=A0A4R1N4A1_9RHOB|nr:VOC family protein [Shimia isoporae]TCL01476.1 catechol 2,3-dioxygenase-like lactoylglutathione lyase family enzyme [Shimia isoporae]